MSKIIISHKVIDYATWKAAFDADSDRREQGGMIVLHVGPGKREANSAFVLMETDNAEEKMAGMFADPDLQSKMEKAGVLEFDYTVA